MIPGRRIPLQPSTAETNFTFRDWIKQTLRNCNPEDDKQPKLPKRVLDVGERYDREVRLIEPKEAMSAKFICLSHCWVVETTFG